jgi:hypothetical protein
MNIEINESGHGFVQVTKTVNGQPQHLFIKKGSSASEIENAFKDSQRLQQEDCLSLPSPQLTHL